MLESSLHQFADNLPHPMFSTSSTVIKVNFTICYNHCKMSRDGFRMLIIAVHLFKI